MIPIYPIKYLQFWCWQGYPCAKY